MSITLGQEFWAFTHIYLKDHLLKPLSPMHKEWFIHTDSRYLAIAAPRGFAKAQSLDSKVLTPTGWSTIGALKTGDFVIGSDGKPTKVLQLHPISEMDLYRVSTRDGRSTLCNGEHLWTVETPSNTGDTLVTKELRELAENYRAPRIDLRTGKAYVEYRHFIHTPKPIELEDETLPIDPYTLGIWLGDGNSDGAGFTTDDTEILSYVPYEWTKRTAKYAYGILGLHKPLRENNLLFNKHIPERYLRGSLKQRTELLQGLIDTDGYILDTGRNFGFCNTNKTLIDGVLDLVRSLGGTATLGEQFTRATMDGPYCHSYRLSCRLPKEINPAKLTRKSSKWKGSTKTKSAITDISFSHRGLGRCITVEAKDGLYVTDGYLLTHNSHIFSFFYPLFRAIESKLDIVLVSSTEGNAEWFLSKIMRECEANEDLKNDYGLIQGKIWRNNYLEFANGSTIRCAGAEGKIRGKRPDLLILDDLENDENVLSEDWRNKTQEWFWKAALYTLKPTGQVIVVGTLVHPLALITKLVTDNKLEGWARQKYMGLVDGLSTWEAQWPTPELIKRRDLNPAAFEQEIQNNPIPDAWRKFQPENFRYYDEVPNGLMFTTTVDPAFELHDKADYSVVLTMGTDTYGNHYVVDYTRARLQPNELIDTIFKHLERWNSVRLGIETAAFQRTLKYYFELEAQRRKKFIQVEELNTSGIRKRYRIEALIPFINQGLIWFNKKTHPELIAELICYPTGDYDDLIDALASQLDVMEKPTPETERVNPRSIKAIINKFHRVETSKHRKRLWHA